MRGLFLVLVALLLTSCASVDYSKYATAMQEHSDAEALRIASQADAISAVVAGTKTETPMESTLLSVIAMMQIERLQPVALGMTAPTTWADVGQSFVGTLPMGFAVGGMVWQAGILAENLTGMTVTDSTISGSWNPTESITGSGSSVTTGATPPVIVEPFIVKPEIIK